MYYNVIWVNDEKTILKIETVQILPSWTYVFQAFEDAVKMVGSDSKDVVLINDPRRDPMPSGGNPIEALRHALRILPSNFVGLIVIAGQQNAFAIALVSAVSRLMIGRRVRIVKTMEDAIQLSNELLESARKLGENRLRST